VRFMLGFLFGLLAGILTLAAAIGGFLTGLIASGAFTEDEEGDPDEFFSAELNSDDLPERP